MRRFVSASWPVNGSVGIARAWAFRGPEREVQRLPGAGALGEGQGPRRRIRDTWPICASSRARAYSEMLPAAPARRSGRLSALSAQARREPVSPYLVRAVTGNSLAALAIGFVLAGVGIGFVATAEHAAVARLAAEHLRGSACGLLATVQSLANFRRQQHRGRALDARVAYRSVRLRRRLDARRLGGLRRRGQG